jgi:surface carbohydrate biosynthesis protein
MHFIHLLQSIKLSNPEKCDVLIYDREGSDVLIKTILHDIDYSILSTRFEDIHITPRILFRFLKRILGIKKQFFKNIKRESYRSYFLSCMEGIQPKVILTFIDNDPTFCWLSKAYPAADFYAIQNGVRCSLNLWDLLPLIGDQKERLELTNFVCFGQNEMVIYPKYGHKIDHYHVVGSLKGSYYKYFLRQEDEQKKFDLCLVSQFRYEIFFNNAHEFFRRASITLHQFLKQYLENNPNLTFCIALGTKIPEEVEYYQKLFGKRAKLFFQHENDFYSTYQAMNISRVVIELDSTAGVEALGWGNKVLFCNFLNEPCFDFYFFERPQLSVKVSEYSQFADKLTELIQMDEEKYRKLTAADRKYLMNYDPQNPVNLYMRSLILEKLKKAGNP